MFERFTKELRQIVLDSVKLAADAGVGKAGPEHLLLTLATAEESLGARVLAAYGVTATQLRGAVANNTRRAGLTDDEVAALRSVGIDAEEVFRRIEEAFGADAFDESSLSAPRRRGRVGGPFDPQARKVVELSLREAIALRHRQIGSEHVLLALLRQGVSAPMSTVLTEHGVTYDDAKARVLAELRNAAA
jgi:ATP-dependent Clp protease ATP-binding subunit ClpA